MTISDLPKKSRTQEEIEGLFQVLPFDTRKEGVTKLSKEMGYAISRDRLDFLLNRVRGNPERYGFSIPLAKLGKRIPGESGPRFVCVRVEHGKDPYFNKGEESQVRFGLVSSISYTQSMLAHEAEALKYASNYYEDPRKAKILRNYARRIKNISDDANDVFEAIKEDNGYAA